MLEVENKMDIYTEIDEIREINKSIGYGHTMEDKTLIDLAIKLKTAKILYDTNKELYYKE